MLRRSLPSCCVAVAPEGPPQLRIKYVTFDPAPKSVGMRDAQLVITHAGGRYWRGERLETSEAGIRPSIVGLGIPGRKPSLEWDFSSLGAAPLDLSRGAYVRGDVKLELYSKEKQALRCWFHTAFIEGGQLVLSKADIDGPHKDRKCKHFESTFRLSIYFDMAPTVEAVAVQ